MSTCDKSRRQPCRIKTLALVCGLLTALAPAQSNAGNPVTVSATDRMSWTPDIGWIDWYGNGTNGVGFSDRCGWGWAWNGNIGWICLGDGSPANGVGYANTAPVDCGVNVDATSNPQDYLLSGYGWAPNAGWISFNVTDPATRPRISKTEPHTLKGYAWSGNIGWIRLEATAASKIIVSVLKHASAETWMFYE